MLKTSFDELKNIFSEYFKSEPYFKENFVIFALIHLYSDTQNKNINFDESILYGNFNDYKDKLIFYINYEINRKKQEDIKITSERLNKEITKDSDDEIGGVIGRGLNF